MNRFRMNPFASATRILAAVCLASVALVHAGELKPLVLPKQQTDGGRPLLQVLRDRKSVREFSTNALPAQTLANLLWAGFGINRPENGHRTAPSAMNCQEIDIYVALSDGLFLYDAAANELKPVHARDIRAATGGGAFSKVAPVALILVADQTKMKAKPADREFYAAIDAGHISQNVYLFCASEGLAAVVHDLDRAALTREMSLRPEQRIVIAQAVGLPKP
jgi:hypothetical protein